VAATATLVVVEAVWDDRFDLENPVRDAERDEVRNPAPMLKTDDIKKTGCSFSASIYIQSYNCIPDLLRC